MAISDTAPAASYARGGKTVVPFDIKQTQVTDPATGKEKTQYEYNEYELSGTPAAAQIQAAKLRAERQSAARSDYKLLTAIASRTDAQIVAYIDANVTDLASAKAVLKIVARAVGMLARAGDIGD